MSLNEVMTVEVNSSKMQAHIVFEAPQIEGEMLTKEQIESQLKAQGVQKGIDASLMRSILDNRTFGKKYLIAKGQEPTVGEPGSIEMMFDVAGQALKPKMLEDGTVDYKNIDNIKTAIAGDVLARVIPHTIGDPGFDVSGEALPGKEGKPAPKLPKGKGTIVSDDGMELIAEVTGKIIFVDNKVTVSETYEVTTDVGPTTGNINFNGSVVVRGNVITDYSIKATGNVEVYGTVEGAEIYSGGNILVSRGVNGMSKAQLQAVGNITVKNVQDASLNAGGDIFAESIMHSKIVTKGRLELAGKKGLLAGGTVHAIQGASVKALGSSMGTITTVHIGSDQNYLSDYNDKLIELNKLKVSHKENIHYLNTMLKRKETDSGKKEIRTSLLNTINTTKTLKAKIEEITQQAEELKALAESDSTNATLSVERIVCPGVTIRIGNAQHKVEDDEYKCKYRNVDGIIKSSPL